MVMISLLHLLISRSSSIVVWFAEKSFPSDKSHVIVGIFVWVIWHVICITSFPYVRIRQHFWSFEHERKPRSENVFATMTSCGSLFVNAIPEKDDESSLWFRVKSVLPTPPITRYWQISNCLFWNAVSKSMAIIQSLSTIVLQVCQ